MNEHLHAVYVPGCPRCGPRPNTLLDDRAQNGRDIAAARAVNVASAGENDVPFGSVSTATTVHIVSPGPCVCSCRSVCGECGPDTGDAA